MMMVSLVVMLFCLIHPAFISRTYEHGFSDFNGVIDFGVVFSINEIILKWFLVNFFII